MGTLRPVLLARCWTGSLERRWLAVDLGGGDRILELPSAQEAPADLPGALVFAPVDAPCRQRPDGGLFLPEGVLWSLLDPLAARLPWILDSADRVELEAELRRQARRFRRRLAWWQNLPHEVRQRCRTKLVGFSPDLGPLLDQFDRQPAILADDNDDVAPGEEGPVAPPSEPGELPQDPEDLYAWFTSATGLGKLYGTSYHPRNEQAEMARGVAGALGQDEALMVEAGTGVGKTLAYLVPLIAVVRKNEGSRAVVSTHTRALQNQILTQDLPRLEPLLAGRKFALLMGRRNYLCLRQRLAFASRPVENLGQALQAAAFDLWLHATSDGMREELAEHPLLADEVPALFDAADLCLPGQCYEGDRCFVQRARQKAREAHLLVVNHSLLLHDMLAEHTLLGEVDHLVVDEAHRLPAVVLETHSVAVGNWRLDEIEELLGPRQADTFQRLKLAGARLATLGREGERAAEAAEAFAATTGRCFRAFRKWWQALGTRVDEEMPSRGHRRGRIRVRDKDEAFGSFRGLTVALLEDLAAAGEAFATFGRRASVLDELSAGLEDDLAQIGQAGQMLGQLYRDVQNLTSSPDEDWVTWLEPGTNQGVRRLGATLLEAGAVLRRYWQDQQRAPIMTSATLAVGEDYTHLMGELGLTRRRPATTTLTCPSPFDFHKQVQILTPQDFPAPGAPDFGQALGKVMAGLARSIPRKTLGLFTSYRLIDEVQRELERSGLAVGAGNLRPGSCQILAQRPGTSTPNLLASFRHAPRAMLLGTNTFWEGVDFPGQELEILVVTKLPFLVPNDPWVEARCEKLAAAGENPFTSFMVRDAVLRLRQGFGRLIRRISDKGALIILDNRLHTKNYGVTFLGALPVAPRTFADPGDLLDQLDQFFNSS